MNSSVEAVYLVVVAVDSVIETGDCEVILVNIVVVAVDS